MTIQQQDNLNLPQRLVSPSIALSAIAWFSALSLPGCSSDVKPLNSVSNFTVQENTFTTKTDMSLTSGGANLGQVDQARLSWRESYTYYDGHGKIEATATKRALSSGVCIDIYDGDGNQIGMVSEKVVKNLLNSFVPFGSHKYFEITDADGKVVAESAKSEMIGAEIVLSSPEGVQLAVLSRSMFDQGKDTWDVEVTGEMDRRLLIFIPSFKTHSDNSKK